MPLVSSYHFFMPYVLHRVASTHSRMFSKALCHVFLLYVYGCSVFQGPVCHFAALLCSTHTSSICGTLLSQRLRDSLSCPTPSLGARPPLNAIAISVCLWDPDSAGEMKHCCLGEWSYHLPFIAFVGCGKCTDAALGALQVAPDWQNAKGLHLFWFSGSNKNQ